MALAYDLDLINVLVSTEQKVNSTSFCPRTTDVSMQRDIYESAAIHLVRGKD